ncbi:MAG: hypothetical protein C4534_01240 [Gaiellales bacterium]|nr:MAG: hypothetical protein C4534_01240 [Gaiellales bacterium]
MWINAKHNKDGLGPGFEYLPRIDRNDFMRSLKAELLLEALCDDDGAKDALRGCVVIVVGNFGPILEFLDRNISGQGRIVSEDAGRR